MDRLFKRHSLAGRWQQRGTGKTGSPRLPGLELCLALIIR
jgi:hypothetical protein